MTWQPVTRLDKDICDLSGFSVTVEKDVYCCYAVGQIFSEKEADTVYFKSGHTHPKIM